VLAGAALAAVPASAASANQVTLWACHGPDGQPLGSAAFAESGTIAAFGQGCDGPSTNGSSGLTASLARTPGYNAASWLRVDVPPGVALDSATVQRSTTGLTGAPAGYTYGITHSSGAALEDNHAGTDFTTGTPSFTFTPPVTGGDFIQAGVSCVNTSGCAASPSGPVLVNVSTVTETVDDSAAPTQAVGAYRSPAAGTLDLDVAGTDNGLGLDHSYAYVQGNGVGTVRVASANFAGTNCTDLTPATPTVDLARDAQCVQNGHVELKVDTTQFPDADYNLIVETYDIAGNRTTSVQPLTIWNHPPIGSPTQTLTIGTSSPTLLPSGGTAGGAGGVAGASATSCTSPKLSMFLSQKPLRVSHNVPVLKYGKRYRFNGRLTCVIKGKRQSAPKRTRIDLRNVIGKKTYIKGGTTVREKGRITIILAYKSSRTLIFRFVNTNGKVSQVKIKIKVAHH
jgi:hypothetical protein